jgi:hypothetical protein
MRSGPLQAESSRAQREAACLIGRRRLLARPHGAAGRRTRSSRPLRTCRSTAARFVEVAAAPCLFFPLLMPSACAKCCYCRRLPRCADERVRVEPRRASRGSTAAAWEQRRLARKRSSAALALAHPARLGPPELGLRLRALLRSTSTPHHLAASAAAQSERGTRARRRVCHPHLRRA